VGRPRTRWTEYLVRSREAAGCGKRRTDRRGDPWERPMLYNGRRAAVDDDNDVVQLVMLSQV
jgi:hypothetical protein